MRRVRVLGPLLLFAAGVGALWWLARSGEPGSEPVLDSISAGHSAPAYAFASGEPPRLLPPHEGTAERPVLAWERLLAEDGSPGEDLAALGDLVEGYLHSGLGDARRSIGFNEDLAAALTDVHALGEAALPAGHPALRDGRVIDRWGTPWQVHPVAGDLLQLRSAGPDQRLYTADDVVEAGAASEPAQQDYEY
jgi:hypothetical protein